MTTGPDIGEDNVAVSALEQRFESRGERWEGALYLPSKEARAFVAASAELGLVVAAVDVVSGELGSPITHHAVAADGDHAAAALTSSLRALEVLSAPRVLWAHVDVRVHPSASKLEARVEPAADAGQRAAECDVAGRAGALSSLPRLQRLLADDGPFVFQHGGEPRIGEVRFAALAAMQSIAQRAGTPLTLETLTVRKAMRVDELERRYAQARAELGHAIVESARADTVAPELHAEWLTRYRLLQRLGRIPYERQTLDPTTGLLPLQRDVEASQLERERPRPHLQVTSKSQPDRVLGYAYREAKRGSWQLDFAETAESQDARRWTEDVLFSLDASGVPEVIREDDGVPLRNADGSFQLRGVLARDLPDVERVLRALQALVSRKFGAVVVRS